MLESFLRWHHSLRMTKHRIKSDQEISKSPSGAALLIKAKEIISDEEEITLTANRNSKIQIVPDVTYKLVGDSQLMIDINPELFNYGSVNCVRYIDSSCPSPIVYVKLHKNIDITDLDYLIKLYLAQ